MSAAPTAATVAAGAAAGPGPDPGGGANGDGGVASNVTSVNPNAAVSHTGGSLLCTDTDDGMPVRVRGGYPADFG